jgi:hypothetical protein
MVLTGLESSPSRARIARILRDDLPMLLRFRRAAVYLAGPSGHPRLLTSIGDAAPTDGETPSRLRAAALQAANAHHSLKVDFPEDRLEGEGAAIVVPLARSATFVVYRDKQPWSEDEVVKAVAAARLISWALGKRV